MPDNVSLRAEVVDSFFTTPPTTITNWFKVANSSRSYEPHLFLAAFASALNSAWEHKCIVQGAIYGPEGATIFIDTEDEQWETHVGISVPPDVQRKLSLKGAAKDEAKPQPVEEASSVQIFESSSSVAVNLPAGQTSVSIFKVCTSLSHHTVAQNQNDVEPQAMLKGFVDAIYSLLDKGEYIQGAMYGPQEGARVFIGGPPSS